jgi:biotin carboxyl carrier protein
MKIRVRVNGRPVELELSRNGDVATVRLDPADPTERAASVRQVQPGLYSVLIGGRSFEVRVEVSANGWTASAGGRRFAVEVEDPRERRRGPGPGLEGRAEVTAPMPGRVVRVLAREGEQVEAGQGLLVVEAMKMQNEMQAPKSGRLVRLTVTEGEAVGAGQILATIE